MNLPKRIPSAVLVTLAFCVTWGGAIAAPVDDSRVMQLEQEVRTLQRMLEQQTRRIDALESALRQPRTGRVPASSPSSPSSPSSAAGESTPQKSSEQGAWRQRANWDKIRAGMSEAEVIRVIGAPTTTRPSATGDAQTLFYAMELEGGGFLSGNIVMAGKRVTEIHPPTLR